MVTIPVVVHVVYKTAAHNISDAQIASQIDVLNADYSAANTDLPNVPAPWKSLVGNARIKFKLASRDPAGNAASGIVRHKTGVTEFGLDDPVKSTAADGSDPWDSARYLNIWVCSLADGLLGYAAIPGRPRGRPMASSSATRLSAPTDRGGALQSRPHRDTRSRHFLNLRHIWGDTEDCTGSDLVSDTPRQQHPNYDEPTFPHVSCSNGPNGDMFTELHGLRERRGYVHVYIGADRRMRAALSGPRKDLTKDAASRT